MKITDIIRNVLDIIDAAEEPQPEGIVAVQVTADPEQEMQDMQKLAGILDSEQYQNTPQEEIAPLGAAFPGGDDLNKPKNPADIRTNAPSMYPGFQAGMK